MLPTKRSAMALARGAHRRPDGPDIGGGEHRVERCGELGVAVPDQEPAAAAGVVEAHEQVAGLLGQPGAGGARGDARMCTRWVPSSMTKNAYSRRRVIVFRWNRSQARIACACARRNSLHDGPARRGGGSTPAVWRIVQTGEAPIW
jgi:hypothetical protein